MTDFKGHILGMLIFLLSVLPSVAEEGTVFSGEVRKMSREAFDLNEASRYDDAYRMIMKADARMSAEMKAAGVAAENLDDQDFMYMYFPLRISLAEISYKLGLFSVMEAVADELSAVVGDRTGEEYMRARLAKVYAGAHYLKGDYMSAEIELLRALGLWTYDKELTRSIRIELAQLYYAEKNYYSALGQLDEALKLGDSRNVRSDKALCLARVGNYQEANELIDSVFVKGDAEWMRRKAKILMLEYEGTGVYRPEAKRLYQDYLSLARRHVENEFITLSASEREQYWQAEKSFVTDCYRLGEKAPELLYDVALFSKAVLLQLGRVFDTDMSVEEKADALAAVRVDWKTVRKKMPKRSAAVEFIVYERDEMEWLGALVLAKNASAPVFVEVAPVERIELMYWEEGRFASLMPDLLWNDKIVDAIAGSDDVYFAADGILHRIPVEFIIPESLEGVGIHRLTSTRMLAGQRRPVRKGGMFLAGGIDYDYGISADDVSNDVQAYSLLAGQGVYLGYLSGSRKEVESIAEARGNRKDSLLSGSWADEAAVRRMMERYGIVHIATHGYFADDLDYGNDLAPMVSDVQLSRNCIFLSGAQRNLEDLYFDPDLPDGILSARELAGMDLSGVDLVVLSACQSGLGYVTADGVFGLQRGLKTAGAGAVVVSLWDVDDVAAYVFFKRFYADIGSGMSVHEAFTEAREYLMTAEETVKRRRAGLHDINMKVRFNDERFYNAFILVDGF